MMNFIFQELRLKKIFAIAFVAATAAFSACNSDVDADQPPTPNVASIPVQVHIQRFEQELFGMDTANFQSQLPQLAAKYPDFLPFFLTQVISDPSQPSMNLESALQGFASANQVRRLNDSCQALYKDLSWLEPQLAQMFRYYKYYLPGSKEPRVVTAVTEFVGDAYPVNDTLMMIGLDLFLGRDFSGYNPEIFPSYMTKQFERPYIPVKIALSLANNAVPSPAQDRILDNMIRNGKVLYLLDCLLPEVPDSIKMGYTAEQLAGCYANEQGLWARLLDLKVLYEPLNSKNAKIVMPGPSTDIVYQESPGEVGNWVGWQIVKSYMKRNPTATMTELLSVTDAQQFLEKAKYKPRR